MFLSYSGFKKLPFVSTPALYIILSPDTGDGNLRGLDVLNCTIPHSVSDLSESFITLKLLLNEELDSNFSSIKIISTS